MITLAISLFACSSQTGKRFQESGINSTFDFDTKKPFSDYAQYKRSIIEKGRIKPTQSEIDKNAPFILEIPKYCEDKPKRGILLIHGFVSSPYDTAHLADYLNERCLKVYSLLLTGHGTHPGDLLNVNYRDWLAEVNYGFQTLSKTVDSVYIGGYSMGGALALQYAARHKSAVEGVTVFSPAISITSAAAWAKFLKLFKPWYGKYEEFPTAYNSFATNGIDQTYRVVQLLHQTLKKNSDALKKVKIFSSFVYEDATIQAPESLKMLLEYTLPKNRHILLYHQSDSILPSELINQDGVFTKNATLLDQNILGLSHLLPLIPENDPLYGQNGLYLDFDHYPKMKREALLRQTKKNRKNILYGEKTPQNLKKGTVTRTSFNPFLNELFKQVEKFIGF